MADNTEKLVTLSNLSDNTEEMKRILKQVRAYIDKLVDTKVDKVSGKQLSTNDYTTTEKNKLASIESGAQKNTVTGIKGNAETSYRAGNVNLTPANIGAAAASHTHAISDVKNLQTTLDGKAAKSHEHSASEITSGTLSIDRIADKSITKEKLADEVFDEPIISTIYIDQNINDPASMISGDINGDAIQAIRANSHRFLGKYTASGIMTICQLSDTDSTKFTDGTAADLTGAQGDVFMRLPEFFTKATETSTDVWQIQFAFGVRPNSTWKKWGGNDLIGVYEAYLSLSKIYSRSGVTPSVSISQADFKTYARNRGTGFTLVKYKHQNIMAFLFFALYGNTNSQKVCGYGTDNYPKTAGGTNSLGMTDTTSANGNSMSINFWGLENWWGDTYEWVDNAILNIDTWDITEDDGTIRQVKSINFQGDYFPKKIVIGNYLDTFANPSSTSGNTSVGYCDRHYLWNNSNQIYRRGYYSSGDAGGITSMATNDYPGAPSSICGSRLAFTGNIVEEKNAETFKSLTAIG